MTRYQHSLGHMLSLNLLYNGALQVSFKVEVPGGKPFMPQQAFMILKSSTGLGTVLVAAKASKGSASDYTATATADIIAKQIGAQVATWSLCNTMGDPWLTLSVRVFPHV